MTTLLDRFLRYVKIDTQAVEGSGTYPSSLKQLQLCELLADECRALGLSDVRMSEYGIVTATVPATVDHAAPAIAWVAHVDTSPETTAVGIAPKVHHPYDGEDILLSNAPGKVIRVADNPKLAELVGGTIVTTDGTTLLGSDDKSGVAVIMTAAAYLMAHREIKTGPVRLVFTCDEEIGHGVDHVDIASLECVCAYTLDGDGTGKIDCETFSADLAEIVVEGVNTHPSIGKGVIVNAIKILAGILSELPQDSMSPETTEGREGFLHPYGIEGGVARASCRIILRDFETSALQDYADLLERLCEPFRKRHPRATIEVRITSQYRNMRDGLLEEPRAVALAEEAMKRAGLQPELTVVRGGTDGSRLTELGLPTPNLSTGEHNPHSPLEWTSVEEMQQAVDVLVELAQLWGQERAG